MPAKKKASVNKSPAKKAVSKKTTVNNIKAPVKAKKTAQKKAAPKSERIEDLVTQREVNIKSVDDYLGIKSKESGDKPIIPGVFDLLIPPGTPRKIILKMARDYNVEVVRRDDIYVPIGISDCERDLLAFRGDEKTVHKLEKILLKELKEFEKTGKVEGFRVIP